MTNRPADVNHRREPGPAPGSLRVLAALLAAATGYCLVIADLFSWLVGNGGAEAGLVVLPIGALAIPLTVLAAVQAAISMRHRSTCWTVAAVAGAIAAASRVGGTGALVVANAAVPAGVVVALALRARRPVDTAAATRPPSGINHTVAGPATDAAGC